MQIVVRMTKEIILLTLTPTVQGPFPYWESAVFLVFLVLSSDPHAGVCSAHVTTNPYSCVPRQREMFVYANGAFLRLGIKLLVHL